jgi:hypothetical protein
MTGRITGVGVRYAERGFDRRQFLRTLSLGPAAVASATGFSPFRAFADAIELNYAFWPFGDKIIADNADIFTEQYGVKVSLQPTEVAWQIQTGR